MSLVNTTDATEEDLEVLRSQLGRVPRGVVGIAARCVCGRPTVVATAPRLPDGTPFPTTYYLTHPAAVKGASTLEAEHVMETLNEDLAADEELRAAYARAHEAYIQARLTLGDVPEISGVSAGGMPTRVKCLHALVGHSLAAGPGVNPIGDRALAMLDERGLFSTSRCSCRNEAMTRVAAIDCGTNSIRLLVADGRIGEDGRPHLSDLTRQMRIVRLGQGVDARGYLDPAAIERTVEATVEYQRMIEALGATSTRFVATSATRDASNSADFVRQIKAVIGVEPEVVVGTEEASLSFNGAVSGLGESACAPMLVVDIGGGSTELVLGSTRVEQAISIDMGAVRVTEKFFSHVDPAGGVPLQDQERAIAWIDEQLDGAEKSVDLARVRSLVGVAGTVTTLTAQALGLTSYQPERIHGARLSAAQFEEAVRFMVDQPTSVKASLGFMPEGREDVIAAGALIWSRIVTRVLARAEAAGHPIEQIVTSEHDILDGIAQAMI